MTNTNRPIDTDERIDRQIDVLLQRDDDTSIIDSLFAVSDGPGSADPQDAWERALFARLQARLSQRMRQSIERPENARTAA